MKFAKFNLVKGRTFTNQVAYPHPNNMGVPPPPPREKLQSKFGIVIIYCLNTCTWYSHNVLSTLVYRKPQQGGLSLNFIR